MASNYELHRQDEVIVVGIHRGFFFLECKHLPFIVTVEMTLGVIGIFVNLMVVSAIRSQDSLQENTSNLLLANLCFSNLIVSFLVKPISAVYVAYALTTGENDVGLAFCSLYTLAFRTTWLVFPFTMVVLCWNSLTTLCLCCSQHSLPQQRHGSFPEHEIENDPGELDGGRDPEIQEFEEMKRAMAFPTIKQKSILGCIWFFASLYGFAACFPEKVNVVCLSTVRY